MLDGVPFPPSLVNIFREIESDLGKPFPSSGRLERWADQGVLLINAILTVRAHQAGSHRGRGWERFTDAVIRELNERKEHLVFMLWGAYAQKKGCVYRPFPSLRADGTPPFASVCRPGFFAAGISAGRTLICAITESLKSIGDGQNDRRGGPVCERKRAREARRFICVRRLGESFCRFGWADGVHWQGGMFVCRHISKFIK